MIYNTPLAFMGSNHLDANSKHLWRELLTPPVIVSALGYFVDIYDLIPFSIVRVQSSSLLA